jgi:hypothetical protein
MKNKVWATEAAALPVIEASVKFKPISVPTTYAPEDAAPSIVIFSAFSALETHR